jgi:lipopolysaccharide export system protein LptA
MNVVATLLVLLALADPKAAPPKARAQSTDGGTPSKALPVQVKALKQVFEFRHRRAVWTGNVNATRGTTRLLCDKLVANYSTSQEITRLECTGNVQVFDGDRWAKGERAEFDNVAGVMELTGSPEVKQGPSHMRGTKVTFFVGTEQLVVENVTSVFESPPEHAKTPKKKRTP